MDRIEHKMPTAEEMRAEMQRKLDTGEPLGASHVPEPFPENVFIAGCLAPPTAPLPGSLTRRGNPRGRKQIKQCSGKEIACLPGKNGACTACADED